jgi:hypothetical protein
MQFSPRETDFAAGKNFLLHNPYSTLELQDRLVHQTECFFRGEGVGIVKMPK